MSKFKPLGAFLRRHRVAIGITQAEVSQRLGYETSQFVSNWERGISIPPLSATSKLCAILDMTPAVYISRYRSTRIAVLNAAIKEQLPKGGRA